MYILDWKKATQQKLICLVRAFSETVEVDYVVKPDITQMHRRLSYFNIFRVKIFS